MKKIDIHLHLQNEKGLLEQSSTVTEMLPHLDELGIGRCAAGYFKPVE